MLLKLFDGFTKHWSIFRELVLVGIVISIVIALSIFIWWFKYLVAACFVLYAIFADY